MGTEVRLGEEGGDEAGVVNMPKEAGPEGSMFSDFQLRRR